MAAMSRRARILDRRRGTVQRTVRTSSHRPLTTYIKLKLEWIYFSLFNDGLYSDRVKRNLGLRTVGTVVIRAVRHSVGFASFLFGVLFEKRSYRQSAGPDIN